MTHHPATANPPSTPSVGLEVNGPKASPNGFPSQNPSRLPQARRLGNKTRAIVLLAALLILGGGGYLIVVLLRGLTSQRIDILTHTVRKENLQMTITERGQLESAVNRDVVCRVKARSPNSTAATTIKWLIDDGSQVKQGQLICELDSSGLMEQLKDQKIKVDQAEAAMITADEQYRITESENFSSIETAKVNLALAEIDLKKYLEGDYLQQKKEILGQVAIAKSDLEMWEERAAWSARMSRRNFVTASQAQADAARLQSARIALQKVEESLRVLDDPVYGMKTREEKRLRNAVDEAKRALDRAVKTAKAKEASADADRKSKLSIYNQELARYHDLEEEIRKCLIYAPQDGIVVYYVPEQSRYGMGNKQSVIAQGETVSEGQKLMQIPDLTKMIVNTKIHEAMVSRVKGERWKRTGFSDAVQGVLLHSNPLSYFVAQAGFGFMRQEFSERYRAQELELVYPGQDARIRIDAFNEVGLMKGHVKSVSTVASQNDWLSSDVKVYQSMVAIDESHEGLKPSMSAEVTIFLDNRTESVLAIPVQAVIGSATAGSKRHVYVVGKDGPELRAITVGMNNEKMVEVIDGLQEGEEVALNPRILLTDKERAKLQVADHGTPDNGDATREKGKGKGKGKGKKAGEPGAAATGGPPGDGPGGFAEMTPEQRKKQGEERLKMFRDASPAQRKQMLEQVPEEFRGRVKEMLKQQGLQVD